MFGALPCIFCPVRVNDPHFPGMAESCGILARQTLIKSDRVITLSYSTGIALVRGSFNAPHLNILEGGLRPNYYCEYKQGMVASLNN